MQDFGALAILFVLFFIVVLAILWILMPLLIMGTNRRLDRLIAQNEALLKAGKVTTETKTSHPSNYDGMR